MTYQASASVTATATSAASTLPPLAIVRSDASGDHRLVETDLRVLINLSARANSKLGGLAYPSVPTIATDIRVDEQHVRKSIHRLIEFGYLTFIGTYPSGTKIHKVIRPGFEIRNGETILNPATPPGGICHPPLAESATQTRKENKEKKLQPPNPRDVAGKSDNVVVLSPAAPKAKATEVITQEAPQTDPPAQLPIAKPVQSTTNSEQHGPTVGIVNGTTVQAKLVSPAKVEPIKPPAPKAEPAHPPAFHYSLTRAESATIMVLMAVLPLDLQAIVMAEFIIQLNGGNVRRPVGYVRKLIEVAKTGGFVPSASREAAQQSEHAAREIEQKRKQAEEERAEAAVEIKAKILLDEAKQKAGNDRLAELRADFIQQLKESRGFTYNRFKAEEFKGIGFGLLFDEYLKKVLLNSEPPHV